MELHNFAFGTKKFLNLFLLNYLGKFRGLSDKNCCVPDQIGSHTILSNPMAVTAKVFSCMTSPNSFFSSAE